MSQGATNREQGMGWNGHALVPVSLRVHDVIPQSWATCWRCRDCRCHWIGLPESSCSEATA